MKLEDLRLFLPKYLSSESERDMFTCLKQFPVNIDDRIYTNYLRNEETIFQGDGIKDLLVINLPQTDIKPVLCMILSNTCDIDLQNKRFFPSQIIYSPIFNLSKYRSHLSISSSKTRQQIDDHIQAIKQQEITQIFYLPSLTGYIDESIVFFDRICNCSNSFVNRTNLRHQRIFTLSDYGAYLFLLKLSIHFTRIQDRVERKNNRTNTCQH
jgi:hypothetical protein